MRNRGAMGLVITVCDAGCTPSALVGQNSLIA